MREASSVRGGRGRAVDHGRADYTSRMKLTTTPACAGSSSVGACPMPANSTTRGRGLRPERHRDARIVAKAPLAVRALSRVAARDVLPLGIRQRAERSGDATHVRLELAERPENGVRPEILADPCE